MKGRGWTFLALISLSIFLIHVNQVDGSKSIMAGIFTVRPNGTSKDTEKYCMLFYDDMPIANDEKSADYFPVTDAMDWDACSEKEPPPQADIDNHLLFVSSENNCSGGDQATTIQKLGGAGTVIVTDQYNLTDFKNDTDVKFPLVYILNSSYAKIMEVADKETTAGMYSQKESFIPISLIIIFILAMFSISVGAFWSGKVRHQLYLNQQCTSTDYESHGDHPREPVLPQEETSMNLTAMSIVFTVVMICTLLLLLYFLYDYLVYFMMGMFCFASIFAVFCCFEPLVSYIPCGTWRTPYFNIYLVRGTLELRQILLLIFAIGLSVTWVVIRHNPWAWILQDFLGVTFSVNVLRVLRLPSLKISTLLLWGLVVYDIFFVFITPFITSDGKSIMVEVAKGGANKEQLPLVFKVPNFDYMETAEVCNRQGNYNLLGFGDVLVPGLQVAFTAAFDRQVGTPCHLYYLINIIGYASGLIVTFIVMFLMSSPQPALLYLVPFTLIPTYITAACRGEFVAMWRGDSEKFEGNDDCDSVDEAESGDDNTNVPNNVTTSPNNT